MSNTPINTVILGASGYTGAELLRILKHHPAFRITALTGESQAGKAMGDVYPHLRFEGLPALVKHQDVDFSDVQLVFCCLPHGTTQSIIAGLPAHVRIVDLSADFRLHDAEAYAEWYGHPHSAMELQKHAVYGLTEHARDAIKDARLVANPGCYPTCSLLPLLALGGADVIDPERIIINAMSGISGAGRSAKQEMLFTELDGGVSAYGVGKHRHVAEIEQEFTALYAAKKNVWGATHKQVPFRVNFTPHLVPMSRGMLATIHCDKASGDITAQDAHAALCSRYEGEPFVNVLPLGQTASSQQVRASNRCVISVHEARGGGLIIVSAIDNLMKGASGQAVQNANLMFGLSETTALEMTAVFP
ncbi:MAG: N-acetyl-gamma-glutamyl-phosphate reductase [Alphaproteobacteria bacterium]|nr:N-acetyl-gamma-glutamyl-phosphate reductase [Alphaproteobacteria bacterium]